MNRVSASLSVLHLVLHGRLRPRLGADRALLFSLSRSNPSWVPRKNDSLDISTV